jgi:hypothetical protein
METIYVGEPRIALRKRLARHIKRVPVLKIVEFVKGNPTLFDGVTISASSVYRFLDTKDKGRVSDTCLAVLERYLEIEAAAAKPVKRPKRTAGLFAELQKFWDMRPETAEELRFAVLGTYAFYAYSEWNSENVCRGAIEFTASKNGDFEAKEKQQSIPFGASIPHYEFFDGHFILGHNLLIAMLRDSQDKHPKFYILLIHPYRNDDKQNMAMDGVLLKIGAKSAVFSGNVHMVRCATAFEECTTVHKSKIDDPHIITCLDSDMWTARGVG